MFRLIAVLLVVFICGCSSYPTTPDKHCSNGTVLADAHFEGGMLGLCTVTESGEFRLTIFPEDKPPINPSPWFSYRLSGQHGSEVVVQMSFLDGDARYWPKISLDGTTWTRLPAEQVTVSEGGKEMELRLTLLHAQVWISAQELLTGRYYDEWLTELSSQPGSTTRLIGSSVQGRPIYMAEIGDSEDSVLLLGRQHPPELTGPIAMRPFVRTLLSDTELARRFRDRYRLVILPVVNPDGVAAGYWRHNVNGVDLNRDWGPFTQPETAAVRDWLSAPRQAGIELRLMLDFHSTRRNVFYTQRDVDPTVPADFTRRWIERSGQRLPDYAFEREASETSAQPNAKNYFYSTYGIPSITYETGDETPRPDVEAAAVVFAEEMMRLMLEYPGETP